MMIQNKLKDLLHNEFQPELLEVENESMHHAGYFEGKESHFKLTIVSALFSDMPLVRRHQTVYGCVAECLTANGGNIHALALHTYTPVEWQAAKVSPNSPDCAGKNQK